MSEKLSPKNSLRIFMKNEMAQELGQGLREKTKKDFSQKIQELLNKLEQAEKQKVIVGSFAPLKDEPLFEVWDKELAYPIENNKGEMAYRKGEATVLKKQFGVKLKIPNEGLELTPDILLIPGIAFDKRGVRLGRGGGFFDRYLEKYSGIKVGVCFDFQLLNVGMVPCETHDQPMDFVVTELKTIECRFEFERVKN